MTFLGWRCWYSDGEVYSSDEYEWEELPDDGLLVRMLYFEDGYREIQQGMDYFYVAPHHSGEPIFGAGMDKDEIEERYPDAVIVRGKWAPHDYYRNIVDEAMSSEWPDDG